MGAILAHLIASCGPFAAANVTLTPSPIAMDASVFFRLRDRIDGAASLEELAAIEAEIDGTGPHVIERRALERRVNRREQALSGPPM